MSCCVLLLLFYASRTSLVLPLAGVLLLQIHNTWKINAFVKKHEWKNCYQVPTHCSAFESRLLQPPPPPLAFSGTQRTKPSLETIPITPPLLSGTCRVQQRPSTWYGYGESHV